jgi:hypothetical protein
MEGFPSLKYRPVVYLPWASRVVQPNLLQVRLNLGWGTFGFLFFTLGIYALMREAKKSKK